MNDKAGKTVLTLRLIPRVMITLLLTTFICFGPILHYHTGKLSFLFRKWTMFAGGGRGIYDVRYFLKKDEVLIPLKHAEMRPFSEFKRNERRILSGQKAYELGRAICDELRPGADVRLFSRRYTRKARTVITRGKINLCHKDDSP